MRFLIIPFCIFLLSFAVIRTSGMWSTKDNWKRICLEVGVSFLAFVLAVIVIGGIVTFFN